MSRYSPQRVRDPLHDLIEFQPNVFEDAMWRVVQTRPFQRLRRVKQLAFSELVYPGATHTRFSHSIGVFHTARILMVNIEKQLGNEVIEHRAKVALAAALVHDVGHGPFSHSFETVGKRLDLPNLSHEAISAKLIKDTEIADCLALCDGGFGGFAAEVSNLIAAEEPTDIYSSVVSSQFDADRLDYMRRDKLMTGTQHSEIDFTWLISNLQIGTVSYGVDDVKLGEKDTLVLGSKAKYAAEAYVLGLFQLYPTVYFHKATRSAEKLFIELFVRVISLIRDSKLNCTGLSSSHPIAKFAKKPDSLDYFLNLDDTVIWGAIPCFCDAKDSVVSLLAKRLRDRKLLKSYDFRVRLKVKLPKLSPESEDRIVSLASAKAGEWSIANSSDLPRLIMDEAKRSPYRRLGNESGPLGRMMIRNNGELVDLVEVSDVVKAAQVFKLNRVYFDGDDAESKKQIESALEPAIGEEKKNAA